MLLIILFIKKVAKHIGEEGQKSLSTCYRSKPEIIYGINEIFSRIIDQYENLEVPDNNSEKDIKEKRLILLTYKNEKSGEVDSTKKVKEAIKGKTALMQEEGLQKYRNIEKLVFEAEKFDKEELFTHEDFVKHIALLNDNNLEDADNAVIEFLDAAVEALEIDEQAKEQIRYLKSSDLGIIIHKILEYKNSELDDSEELLIDKAMYEILGEDNVNSLEDKTRVKNKIKSYIANYESIEKKSRSTPGVSKNKFWILILSNLIIGYTIKVAIVKRQSDF